MHKLERLVEQQDNSLRELEDQFAEQRVRRPPNMPAESSSYMPVMC